jgi:hypothetical protein
VAFLLPLGGSDSPRKLLTMRGGLFVEGEQRHTEGRVVEAPIPDDLLRKGDASAVGSVAVQASRATSRVEISLGEESAVLETVPVQPRFWLLIVGVVAAWLTFAFALDVALRPPNGARYQQIQGIRLEDRRMLAALSIVVWAFLLLRLGLSLRYGWDPAHVDKVVVEGVAWALFGLAVVPGLVLRSAMMWLVQVQEPNHDDARHLRVLTGVIVAVGAGEMLLAECGFWPALAPQFQYGARFWVVFLSSLTMVFLWACIRINHEYFWDKKGTPHPPGVGRVEEQIHRFVLELSTRYSDFARSLDTPLWQKTFRTNLQDKPFWRAYAEFAAAILVFVAAYASVYWLFHISFPGTEPLKEVIAPALLCLPPICFLLNSRVAFPAGLAVPSRNSSPAFMRLCAVVAALVLLLAVVYPIVLGDPGALVVTSALFVPTSIILIVGGTPSRIPLLTFGFVAAGFVAVALLVLQFQPVLEAAGVFGEMKLRVMEFGDATNIERNILFGSVGPPEAFSFEPPLRAARMQQTHQHLWEMRAIARVGGYTGLGFGQAPVRSSQVRQDTLQYDSTFSFFVLSEHGLLGGGALLGLYGLPILIILASARRKLDVGHALALIIASSFFLEAASHALMNVGSLPETGRSMPLLAVKSISDLLRWTIFFRIAAQALMWRVTSSESGYSREPALLPERAVKSTLPAPYWRTWALWFATTGMIIAAVSIADARLIGDSRLKELNWKGLLASTNSHIRQKHFFLRNGRIEASAEIRRSGELLFFQEMARFNQLTDAEKVTGLPRDEARRFCASARSVHSVIDFDRLMNELRLADRPTMGTIAPSLFVLTRDRDEWGADQASDAEDTGRQGGPAPQDSCALGPDSELKLRANAGFVSVTRFERHFHENPPVFVGSGRVPVIGSAWVEGHKVEAVDPDVPIPWLDYLRNGITSRDYVPPTDSAGRVILTLDLAMQRDAQQFLTLYARDWHEKLLTRHDTLSQRDAKSQEAAVEIEPPRAALAILNLKNGEVLALAGFPYMTPGEAWRQGAAEAGQGGQWIPPTRWIERRAPSSLRLRYGGDRNFDRLLMGSTTKPLWASAAVDLHPSLDAKLGVSGHGGNESEVFGIPIRGKAWEVDERSAGLDGGWCDFKSYLAKSDNRYHIRLGFLSLAEWAGNSPGEGALRVPTGDDARETIDLSTQWTRYPVFPASIRFSAERRGQMLGLERQPLADRLGKLFGIETRATDEAFVRSSFWTGNEQDDSESAPLGSAMRAASPERVNMAFDEVRSPRDFVTLLLGGGANRWANVDFAGAFGSAVVGRPVIPHIVRLPNPPSTQRIRFEAAAGKIRPGLEAAYSNAHGTVWKQFGPTARAVKKVFDAHSEFQVYGKTGTLPSEKGMPNTSRLVLAVVRWEPGSNEVKSGLVFSIVIDRGRTGLAANWLGHFIDTYRDEIARALER